MAKQKIKIAKILYKNSKNIRIPFPPTHTPVSIIYPLKMTHLTENMDYSRSLPICRPDWCWNQASSLNATLIITTSTWQKNRARSTGPEEQWLITQKESCESGFFIRFHYADNFYFITGVRGGWMRRHRRGLGQPGAKCCGPTACDCGADCFICQ